MKMSQLVKSLVLVSVAAVSTMAVAAPKMTNNVYGIAGLDLGNGATQGKLGVGTKITKDVSAEVLATARFQKNFGVSCTTFGVNPRGIYHAPVDLSGIKPYAGVGLSYARVSCSSKVEGVDFSIDDSDTDFGYVAGVDYPINNKIKVYADLNGSFRAVGNPVVSIGAKMGF